TVIHWSKFNHRHVAFWLWAGLYFTTPFLVLVVLLRNRRWEASRSPLELTLPPGVRTAIGATGLASLVLGLYLVVSPVSASRVWPWALTSLTGRVVGAVFLLGVAGVGMYLDPRWTTARLMLQVEQIMIALILLAAARAHRQLSSSRPLTWILLAGLLGSLV